MKDMNLTVDIYLGKNEGYEFNCRLDIYLGKNEGKHSSDFSKNYLLLLYK